MKVVIVSGGDSPSLNMVESEMTDDCIVIAADSGADCLYSYGIIPDYLIGDFDSADDNVIKYFIQNKSQVVRFPREKDFTDSYAALEKAEELKPDQIVFLGCLGKRVDHLFANIGMLNECLKRGIKAEIKDENNTIFLSDKPVMIYGKKGDIFSLEPFGGEVKEITLANAKYKLEKYNLKNFSGFTVSNEFDSDKVYIDFKEGTLIIFLSKEY